MNMKKTIAGTVASIVAVSAIAATVASAKEISYAAIDKTINVADDSWKANGFEDSFTQDFDTEVTAATVPADVAIYDFGTAIKDLEFLITNVTTGDKTKVDVDNDDLMVNDTQYALTGLTLPLGEYSVKVSFTVKPTDEDGYSSQEKAEDRNEDLDFTVTAAAAAAPAPAPTANALIAAIIANTNYTETAEFDVDNDDDFKIDANGSANLSEGVIEDIAEALEARTKASIILNFEDPDFDDSDAEVTLKVYGTTFNSTTSTVDYDDSADTATFDWAAMTKAATSGSTLGDVSRLFDEVKITMETDDVDDDEEFVLKSVTVKGPAESFLELSAGESVEDSAADITTAPAATTAPVVTEAPVAATTAPAANPTTGNAPIALAVIPVAIAAAAIIAKKRG